MKKLKLIGPFTQIVTMSGMNLKGPLNDQQLSIIKNGGILINEDRVVKVDAFEKLIVETKSEPTLIEKIETDHVLMPGFIDAHTHICFSGSRAKDYALRNEGVTYLEIAKQGGGIWDTVTKTRIDTFEELVNGVVHRCNSLLKNGITTVEVKSGYGLSVEHELKMLRAIKTSSEKSDCDIIATCLAAHIIPKEFSQAGEYLDEIIREVFPLMRTENLSNRVDAFIEDGAYNADQIKPYLEAAKKNNFDITIHADQFHTGGTQVAVEYEAVSADHLEASGSSEIALLAQSNTIATALPGASLGLGCSFAPARKILDKGGALAIASDWNPGSAPMGHLLTSAAIFGAFEKLSAAEVFAGITFRAAAALKLKDRGKLQEGFLADFIAFPCNNYNEILYHQGQLQPSHVWKNGVHHSF